MSRNVSTMGRLCCQTVTIIGYDQFKTLKDMIEEKLDSPINWEKVIAATISCEGNDCRISYGSNSDTSCGHVVSKDLTIRISNNDLLLRANVVNKTAGQNATLQVTLER